MGKDRLLSAVSAKDAIEKRFKIPLFPFIFFFFIIEGAYRDIKGGNKSEIAVFSCTAYIY